MTDMVLQSDLGGGIALLTLNRPPVNALNPAFLQAIAQKLHELDADPDVRALVLYSPFKVLSAGLDLKEAQGFSRADQTAVVDGLNAAFASLYAFSKPVTVGATGAAIAGGLFFVLAADYVVAAPKAKFGLAEVRVGVNFPIAPLEIARATLPPAALNRMMLGGEPVDVARAQELGFVDQVTDQDQVLTAAEQAARRLASSPPLAYAAIKAQIRAGTLTLVQRAIAAGSDPARAGWFTEQTQAAMQTMLAPPR